MTNPSLQHVQTIERDPRWTSIANRDASADGSFFYSVKTTGVYCRPSCSARLPDPHNVQFHLTRVDAQNAGFRACRRCKPDHSDEVASRTAETKSDSAVRMPSSHDGVDGAPGAIQFAIAECSLGSILVAASERGLCAIAFGDDPDVLARDLQDLFPHAERMDANVAFQTLVTQVVRWVEAPVEVPAVGCDLSLDMRGTDFQQSVWQALREIPPGSTASYSEIARRIGAPKSVRAVAGACAANTLAVVIPCHRAVRSDGNLSGYRWGVERKRTLLARESHA